MAHGVSACKVTAGRARGGLQVVRHSPLRGPCALPSSVLAASLSLPGLLPHWCLRGRCGPRAKRTGSPGDGPEDCGHSAWPRSVHAGAGCSAVWALGRVVSQKELWLPPYFQRSGQVREMPRGAWGALKVADGAEERFPWGVPQLLPPCALPAIGALECVPASLGPTLAWLADRAWAPVSEAGGVRRLHVPSSGRGGR